MQVTRANGSYTRRKRDLDSVAPREALGIVRPVISPDGKKVAFAAVGDIYVMDVGGKPVNITKDKYLDTDPAWSPDGTQLVYSSDKGNNLLQLWIHDMKTGQDRQLKHMSTRRGSPDPHLTTAVDTIHPLPKDPPRIGGGSSPPLA